MKPPKPLSRQTHQLIGQRTISLSQQPGALPRIFQMTVTGAANFTNSLSFDGLEQNNDARLPSGKPEMKTSDPAITWFNVNARDLKGSKSEYVYIFSPHGTLTSC